MVDPKVQESLEFFCNKWKQIAGGHPILRLDGTWPSVGVVDLMTLGLRGVENYDDAHRELLRGSAAYLAILTEKCWSTFQTKSEVVCGDRGVTIIARSGPGLEGGSTYYVNVEKELQKILENLPLEFPVIADFTRPSSPDHNYLSLFGIGLVTGLSPLGDGPWLKETMSSFKGNIDQAVRYLARSSAKYYEEVFPDEQLGQVGELYLNGLIFPPMLCDEPLAAMRAVKGLADFAKEYQVGQAGMQKLCENLSQSPDELIASAGLAFYGAVCGGDSLSPKVLAVAEAKGRYVGVLRTALLEARAHLGIGGDWIKAPEFGEKESREYEVEKRLGFLPWLKLPKNRIKSKNKNQLIETFVEAVSFFDLKAAIEVSDKILEEAPGDIDFKLQRIYLDILCGEFDRADRNFRHLASEPGAERNALMYNLWGVCSLQRNDVEQAVKYLGKAYSLSGTLPEDEKYQVANDYAWALMVKEKFSDAVDVLDTAIKTNQAPVTAMLNKIYALRVLEKFDAASTVHRELYALSPLDLRVFGNQLYESSLTD